MVRFMLFLCRFSVFCAKHDFDLQDTAVEHLVWWGYQPSDTVGKHRSNPHDSVSTGVSDRLRASTGKLATANVTVRAEPLTSAAPLEVTACGYSNFGLYHVTPVSTKSGFAFLGEVGKWVPVASGRVTAVTDEAAKLSVEIIGVASEEVKLVFAKKGGAKPSSVVCKVGSAGTATATYDGSAATCA